MTTSLKKRNLTIDLLRCLAIFLVIRAHCGLNETVTNYGSFEVSLMIFVSGMSYSLSGGMKESYFSYVRRRFFRLIVPVWIFLIFFFVFFRFLGRTFTPREIAESFLLLAGGVLFVWVYRIFFTTALLNPFLDEIRKKTGPWILPLMALVFLISDFFSIYVFEPMGTLGSILQYLFTYTINFGLISLGGMVFHSLHKNGKGKGMILFGLFFLALYLITGTVMHFPRFYDAKYPPTAYYCSYGLAWSAFLYLIAERIPLPEFMKKPVIWISVHTMDIFMWHIFLFYFLDTLSPALMEEPLLDLLVFFGGAILAAWIQEKLIQCLKDWKAGR